MLIDDLISVRFNGQAFGSALITDLDTVLKKVGYRNPTNVDIPGTSHVLVQANEGQVVRFTGNVVTVTVNTLEVNTEIRTINVNGPSAVVMVKSSLTLMTFLDGAPAVSVSSVSIGPGGSADMRWVTNQHCEVTGLHCTGNV